MKGSVESMANKLSIDELTVPKKFGEILTWLNKSFKSIVDFVNNLKTKVDEYVLCGVYVGNGEAERTIELGFEPVAVVVYRNDGWQSVGEVSFSGVCCGGLAMKEYPTKTRTGAGYSDSISVCKNGFKVSNIGASNASSWSAITNTSGQTYYFIAYKHGNFTVIN